MDRQLMDILVCPICKGPLIYDKKNEQLICPVDKKSFPIRNDIPIMLESEAGEVDDATIEAFQ